MNQKQGGARAADGASRSHLLRRNGGDAHV